MLCNNPTVVTLFWSRLMQSEESKMPEIVEENKTDELSIEQQLIDAKKEIDDLKLQIQWLERPYE